MAKLVSGPSVEKSEHVTHFFRLEQHAGGMKLIFLFVRSSHMAALA